MNSPSSTFVAHQLALEPNAATQDQGRPSAATALPPGPGPASASDSAIVGPAASPLTTASGAGQNQQPAQPGPTTASSLANTTPGVSEGGNQPSPSGTGQNTAIGQATTASSASVTDSTITSSSTTISSSSSSSSSSASPPAESNLVNGAPNPTNAPSQNTWSQPASTWSSSSSSWSAPPQPSNTWQETSWTDSVSPTTTAFDLTSKLIFSLMDRKSGQHLRRPLRVGHLRLLRWQLLSLPITRRPALCGVQVRKARYTVCYSSLLIRSGLIASSTGTTGSGSSIPPPPSGTSLVLASSQSATAKSDSTSAGALGAEDGTGSSTKQGMSGGAIAGLIIAILLLMGIAGCIWQKKVSGRI